MFISQSPPSLIFQLIGIFHHNNEKGSPIITNVVRRQPPMAMSFCIEWLTITDNPNCEPLNTKGKTVATHSSDRACSPSDFHLVGLQTTEKEAWKSAGNGEDGVHFWMTWNSLIILNI
jgi:hypothetical protein